ncbi:MAG: hypothetical protein KF889_08045 [Alphaproteobacteria bacterium]|nr:hypothetical protein [Alphaproteobacteria bacterium]MCW5740769.1 hypothetical protein [Alphaproteobacteria bacterium]
MKYLGALRGSGTLVSPEGTLGDAAYEIDGYLLKPGEIAASGELRMAPDDLARAFGLRHLRLRTEDGRELTVRFTARKLPPASPVAHADFGGDLPQAGAWGR